MGKKNISKSYDIKIARSVEEVKELRAIWKKMQCHPNADIDTYLTVLSSREDILRPHVMTLYMNPDPISMVVGRIEYLRLELKIGYKVLFTPRIRSLTIVYGGILGKTTPETTEVLFLELMNNLAKGEADAISFSNLRTDSEMYRLATTMPNVLFRSFFKVPNLHWRMTVPRRMDEFYQTIDYKFRKNLRRSVRKLVKVYPDNVTVQCFREKHEVDRFMRDAEEIAKKTYQRGLDVGFIDNVENRRLITLAAERGWLRSYVLYIDGNPVSFEKAFQYGNILFCGASGYDPAYYHVEPGTNIFLKVIEELCHDEAIAYIDFGFGDAQYKRDYSDQNWEEEAVYIFAPKLKNLAINLIRTMLIAASRFAEELLKRTGLAQKIKRYWRNRLAGKEESQ